MKAFYKFSTYKDPGEDPYYYCTLYTTLNESGDYSKEFLDLLDHYIDWGTDEYNDEEMDCCGFDFLSTNYDDIIEEVKAEMERTKPVLESLGFEFLDIVYETIAE